MGEIHSELYLANSWHLLCDREIAELAERGMITPFVSRQVRQNNDSVSCMERILSYGLGPCGYDVRLGTSFKGDHKDTTILDPKQPPAQHYCFDATEGVVVAPGTMLSGVTVETFTMPNDVQGLCIGKSSYTRIGLLTQFTGIEPGFRGTLTVQMFNVTPHHIYVYPGEGILQVLFWRCPAPTRPYAGYFQGQRGVVVGVDDNGLREEEHDGRE